MSETKNRGDISPPDQKQGTQISPEQIDQMNAQLVAMDWQNFLKNFANGIPEQEARQTLIQDLQRHAGIKEPKNKNLPLLEADTGNSVDELKHYLNGFLDPEHSRFACGALPKLQDRNPNFGPNGDLDAEKYEKYLDAQEKYNKQEAKIRELLPLPLSDTSGLYKKYFKLTTILDHTLSKSTRYEKQTIIYDNATAQMEQFEKEIMEILKNTNPELQKKSSN